MPYFVDGEEVRHYLGGMFEAAQQDPVAGAKLRAADLVVRYVFTDPDVTMTVRLGEPRVEVLSEDLPTQPDLTISMSADDGDRFWRGKLNAALALARGQVSIDGPPHKLLKLIPAAKSLYPIYSDLIATKDTSSS